MNTQQTQSINKQAQQQIKIDQTQKQIQSLWVTHDNLFDTFKEAEYNLNILLNKKTKLIADLDVAKELSEDEQEQNDIIEELSFISPSISVLDIKTNKLRQSILVIEKDIEEKITTLENNPFYKLQILLDERETTDNPDLIREINEEILSLAIKF